MAFQRQNWQPSDSGILKKKDENEEELLVFGYSCKLFRDDEKALYVDQGKHLIPWMGDESLRIDRYDVRGALYDVSQYEAISGHQEELFWVNLSSEERRIEQLCDEERYRALTHNEDEERLYQEEELKRLHQALGSDKTYGQVSYSYDEENGDTEKPAAENQTDESDEPFVPPPELDLPQDIVLPETVKLNAIIEKTAMFINKQGSQMEIILKMKQASNPQFEFLSYGSPLHGYYRHVLGAIKSGRYKPKSANTTENKTDEENASTTQSYYLHHTLAQVPVSSVNVDVAPSIPSINYKPSSDCAYSMLVNKIRNNQNKLGLLSKPIFDTKNDFSETSLKDDERLATITASPKLHDSSDIVDDGMDYAESELKTKPSSPTAATAVRPNRRKRRKRQQGGFAYNDDVADGDSIDGTELRDFPFTETNVADEQVDPEGMDTTEEQYEIPPPDLQLIIDKMACYVGKNGRDFEEIVKSKADPRFSFLNTSSPYHVYYRKKVESYEFSQKDDKACTETWLQNSEKAGDDSGSSTNVSRLPDASSKLATSKPTPVCFSIKRPKETESLEIKSALPVEESSDEDNEENGTESANDNMESVDGNVDERVTVENANVKSSSNAVRSRTNTPPEEQVKEKVPKEKEKDKLVTKVKDKESVKDKEKPKLSSKEKERQLQLERKKRAAAFLNQLQKMNKNTETEIVEKPVVIGPQLPDEMRNEEKLDSLNSNDDEVNDNDDSDSATSPPSSVTSPEVTLISETPAGAPESPKTRTSDASPGHDKAKRAKYSSPEKYATSRRARDKDGVEYKHKHRKRKRSRTPTRKRRSHSSRSHFHGRFDKEVVKHRKHRRHQKSKEWRHGQREFNTSGSASGHHRHKHYKLKKHKRKEEKKYNSKSSVSEDSDSD